MHEEADYEREARYLSKFGSLLAGSPDFCVPKAYHELTTPSVLAMQYIGSVPIESLVDADQPTRDRVMRLLIELVFRELFDFRMMQTDPNFANYRFDAMTKQVVLLD